MCVCEKKCQEHFEKKGVILLFWEKLNLESVTYNGGNQFEKKKYPRNRPSAYPQKNELFQQQDTDLDMSRLYGRG